MTDWQRDYQVDWHSDKLTDWHARWLIATGEGWECILTSVWGGGGNED